MDMDELKKRKSPRHKIFDYNSVGVYFITICTKNRRCILSHIVGTDATSIIPKSTVGTGVLDCPSEAGVLDCPSEAGVLDCPRTELTRYGEIADKYIKQLNDFYDYLSVEEYAIMPNHIHLLLWVKENKKATDLGQSRTPVPTNVERANSVCSQFVSTFKRFCNKEYGENIWQPRFHDHIIRNRDDYEEHVKYIYENPLRWHYDELYTEE